MHSCTVCRVCAVDRVCMICTVYRVCTVCSLQSAHFALFAESTVLQYLSKMNLIGYIGVT